MKNHLSGYRRKAGILAVFMAVCMVLPVMASANTQGVIYNPNGGSYVNVRSWPSYEADILTELAVGTAVEITGTSGVWYSVWVDGVVGYIHSNFVRVNGSGGAANATVRSGPLNMREAPSMRARVIMQLPTGYRVAVTNNEGTWSRLEVDGTIGYVVTSFLSMDGSSPSPTPKPPVYTENANATIRTTNGGNLNLRAYAGSSAPILDSFANTSRVRVISRGNWCYVQAGSLYGYMSSQFLVFDGGSSGGSGYDAVVQNPGGGQVLNLRAEPSTTSRSLGQYYNGTTLKVLGVGTEWHRVNVDGVQGYMMAKYVRITSSGATPHKTVTGGTGGYVNLRSGAGYGFDVLKRVTNGSAASVEIPYPVWSKVVVRQGSGYLEGYMMNSFLK